MEPFDIDLDSGDWFDRQMPKGQRTKYELRPLDAVPPVPHWQWFWKSATRRAPFEVWSEVLAYRIGTLIGTEVPLCIPSRCRGEWGVLIKSFLQSPDDILYHGGDFLVGFDRDYDRELGTRASIQAIYAVIQGANTEERQVSFFETLVLDALIGNMDRHQENWGIHYAPDRDPQIRMAPAFDNGASLAKEFKTDDAMRKKWEQVGMAAYAEKGTSEIRWQCGDQFERLTHFEFMDRHFQAYEWSIPIARRNLGYNESDLIGVVLDVQRLSLQCPGIEMSDYRAEQILALLAYRRDRLIGLLP